MSGAFGTNTSTSGGGLFGGNNTFGKPTTSAPTFGFNAPSTGLGTYTSDIQFGDVRTTVNVIVTLILLIWSIARVQ